VYGQPRHRRSTGEFTLRSNHNAEKGTFPDTGAFFTLLELLNSKALDRNPERARELAQSLAEQAAAQAG